MSERTTCRVCEAPIKPVFSLGEQYVSDFLDSDQPDGLKAPLTLAQCSYCKLVQLTHTVLSDRLYKNYWYRSGTNKTMCNDLADVAAQASWMANIKSGDTVLDIGCNDGTLLGSYERSDICKVGFDPAENLAEHSVKKADHIISDFFSADQYLEDHKPAQIITSIAMFYDLEDPNKFVADVRESLHDDGLWVIQMSYLPSMLEQHDFGNICHEHLEYYSLRALEYLLDCHDFRVVDVELNKVNGGSFRAYIRKNKCLNAHSETYKVKELRQKEDAILYGDQYPFEQFGIWCERIKDDVQYFINREIDHDRSVGVYGASTKGNVMLQYFGLDDRSIAWASDRNPDKWGKVMVGSRVLIVSEEDAREAKLDNYLVLPWHFIDEFCQREQEYLFNGGRFIVPCPHFTLI